MSSSKQVIIKIDDNWELRVRYDMDGKLSLYCIKHDAFFRDAGKCKCAVEGGTPIAGFRGILPRAIVNKVKFILGELR